MIKLKHIYFFFSFFLLHSVSAQTIEKRVDTLCTNMAQINSKNDDYLPFIIDNHLMFTSNRRSVLERQSLQYTEKVYFSTKTENSNDWSKPKKNGYKWNSDNNTALIGLDDDYFYFYRAYWRNNGEIFFASRKENPEKPWQASKISKLKSICTDDYDESSIVSLGKDSILFVSNKNGNYNILMKRGKEKPFLVNILNSDSIENDLFYVEETKTLYFSSNRAGGIGGWDIYMSNYTDNEFTTPVLLQDTMINTSFDERDFRWYNDSTKYLSSNREGGMGGWDIYEWTIRTTFDTIPDTTQFLTDSLVQIDTIPQELDTLTKQLEANDLLPFRGEIQLGAFRYINSLKEFETRFPCIKGENVRMDTLLVDGITIHKFIIDTIYTEVDVAMKKRTKIMDKKCLPNKLLSDMPFVGVLDKQGNRFAIFWEKDEFINEKVFYLFKNGKQVWKGRRF